MTEWVLVLTIIVAPNNLGAPAIHSVAGFSSYAACVKAGEKWGRVNLKRASDGTMLTAVCVSNDGSDPVRR